MQRAAPSRPLLRQSGLTLVEIMITMLIGLFLMLGTVTVYLQSRSSYRVSDGQARLQENVRFALDLIDPDVRLAQFWGRNNEPGLVNVPGGIAVTCGGIDVSALALNFVQPVTAVDDTIGYNAVIPCPANTAARADSDALIVRHVSAQQTPPTAGTLQVHSDLSLGQLFNDGAIPPGFGPNAQTHDLVVNVYYVDNGSNLDPNLPSLRRWTLDAAGNLVEQEILTGVENLQVQFGVDTNGLGSVTRYVDPNDPVITPGAPGFLPNAEVLAVRLWMLMRTEEQETGFVDAGPYLAPDADLGAINPGGAAYPAGTRRQQVTKTIFLRNNRG